MTVSVCVSLGIWQLRRHAWREAWLAERNARIDLPPVPLPAVLLDPEAQRDRRTEARGRFLPAESITVREVTPAGEEGVSVLTPLVLEPEASSAGGVVLVDRGFVPAHAAAAFLEADRAAPPASVAVVGRVLPLALGETAPGSADAPRREWLRFDGARPETVSALQAQLSRRLSPVLLESDAGPPGTLPRGGIQRPVSPVSHLSYAIFWLGVAGGAVLTWIGLGRQRVRDAERAAHRASIGASQSPPGRGER